jgi:hypothetical protein
LQGLTAFLLKTMSFQQATPTSRPAKSFRLEMLQVARLAPQMLGDSASLVENFLRTQLQPTGGFADREGKADVYYTVFGLEALQALRLTYDEKPTFQYLSKFGSGHGLDFVHLCSLARCMGNLGRQHFPSAVQEELVSRIEKHRTPDGGYHGTAGRATGSAYGALLAWGAYADLGVAMPVAEHLLSSVERLGLPDGSYANEPGLPQGTTTATSAAVTLTRHLGGITNPNTGPWLLQQLHPGGGFLATPGAPLPDLLSTATALHALESLEVPFSHVRDVCLDFIDTLWSAEGGFHGHWADDDLDVEYTSYGLLALGHLST